MREPVYPGRVNLKSFNNHRVNPEVLSFYNEVSTSLSDKKRSHPIFITCHVALAFA